ncbi:MAG: ATP-dependent helicase [Deltaproteobacteria bacterium]|nr:ATP-dependent helicase [Deltaproteobacteria bacterium]
MNDYTTGMSSSPTPPIDFEEALNPRQLAAVEAVDGAHLVIAGPGSGKTRTLVYRVANLVLKGVPPESILLLTFTRKSAQEMLRRASGILDQRCRRVAGGTFHSFANRVLRRHAPLLGYKEGFTILDRSDAADVIGVLRTEGGYDRGQRRFPRKSTLLDLFSKLANTKRSLEELVLEDYPHFSEELEALTELATKYAQRKKAQNVVDYDDLLVLLRQLLSQHEGVRRKLSATYRYVMVDEYQDTNHLQAHIAALLASGHGNLMVVGDEAQSIYSFRGASFKNIIDFPKLFPNTKTTLLEQSYRSTQPILDLANGILANAREKFSKSLFTRVEGDVKPRLVVAADDYAQANFIRRQVLELREEGVPLQDIAVLSRASWHTNSLEVELNNANIPFRKFGGLRFVEAAHVKDVSAFLKIVANPLDSAAWFRVLQLFEGVGPKTAQKITRAVADAGGRWSAIGEVPFKGKRYGTDLVRLARLLDVLADDGPSVAERVVAAITYYRPLLARRFDDAPRRQRDLEALEGIAQRYTSLERFLTDIAIDPPELAQQGRGESTEDEWMTISTVHSAKGLEWHSVFVINLNSGHFPSQRSLMEEDGLEEERRLFYVAATRAKRNLFLLRPEELPTRGPYSNTFAEVSELLEEIDGFDEKVEQTFYSGDEEDLDGEELEGGSDGDGELFSRIQDYFGGD